jgi:heat shock protein HtpX
MNLQRNEVLVSSPWKKWGLYLACLGGILISYAVLVTARVESLALIAAYLVIYSLIYLLIAAVLSEKAHKIQLISSESTDQKHILLTQIVSKISKQAGLEVEPKVGIYQSENMNAFAMGMSKKNSLIAFSSSLLQKMDDNSIEAVAAHEISHIANGDMVTMCLIHALINGLVLLVKIPLAVIKFFVLLIATDRAEFTFAWLIGIVSRIIQATVLFLGNLLAKAFSRKREYKADLGAAFLVNPQSMIQALKVLSSDSSAIPQEQQNYAAFKINAPARLISIFSTHPSIEKRISALQQYVPENKNPEVTNIQIDNHHFATQFAICEEKNNAENLIDSLGVAQQELPLQNEEDDLERAQIPQIAASTDNIGVEDQLVLLRNLKELVDLGILSREEFEDKKKKILDCI